MEFAATAEQALAALEERKFDALVTDLLLPGMGGAQLLERVGEQQPGAVRLVLSGENDARPALQALTMVHQLLNKPCGVETLRENLSRGFAIEKLLANTSLRGIVEHVERLPSRPRTYGALCQVMAKPTYLAAEVAGVVERDAAVASHLLRMANKPVYGGFSSTSSISQAVVRLGSRMVRSMVLAAEMAARFERTAPVGDVTVDTVNDASIRIGHAARQLILQRSMRAREDAEEAFLIGLIHQVGTLVMMESMRKPFKAALREHQATGEPMAQCERKHVGADASSIGAFLIARWGLPYSVIEGVAHAGDPARWAGNAMNPAVAVTAAKLALDHEEPPETLLEPLPLSAIEFERLQMWVRHDNVA